MLPATGSQVTPAPAAGHGKSQERLPVLTKGQRLNRRYDVVEPLSRGGMGAIYHATDKRLGVAVAIKENCVSDPKMRAAFKREAQLLANLRHPSLPRCTDFLEVDGGQFLVMEFIEGDDLAALMVRARAPLTNKVLDKLAWQMLDVIQYLEEEGIHHRDIKPHNIKFKDSGFFLIDFGIAHGLINDMDTVGVGEFNGKYGSKLYSPPEQLQWGIIEPSCDLYSLGATLYYTMTNVQPTGAVKRLESLSAGGEDPLQDVRFYNRAADARMSRAVMRALSLNPKDRPQSAAELREMMFPDDYAPPKATGVRRFLTLRLLSEALLVGVFACILTFALRQPQKSDAPPAIALDTRREVTVPTATPTPEYTLAATATPVPTPVPTEEVAKESRPEQAARLADEADRDRQSGRVEVALSKLKRAFSLDEKNAFVHYLIGDIRLDAIVASGRLGEQMPEVLARAESVLALTHSPRSGKEYIARAWAKVAKAYRDPADPDRALLGRAIDDANEVLTKYDPNSAAALTIRGSARYLRAGSQIDERTARRVLEDFERVVKLTPADAQAHANRARIYFELASHAKGATRSEHLELARQGFEKATRLAPRADFFTDLGDVHFKLGNFKKAGEIFQAAIQEDANYQRAHERLSATYNKLGQPKRAAEALARAHKPHPNDSGARRELQRAAPDRTYGR